jgi:KUP system potassium uptake protein
MFQNAGRQSDFFKIPANRLVELGAKVEIWKPFLLRLVHY